jgi:hypothetical protein
VPLLFCGKTTLEDMRTLRQLVDEGLVVPPKYLPEQFRDMNALSAWMCFSNFLNHLSLDRIEADYQHPVNDAVDARVQLWEGACSRCDHRRISVADHCYRGQARSSSDPWVFRLQPAHEASTDENPRHPLPAPHPERLQLAAVLPRAGLPFTPEKAKLQYRDVTLTTADGVKLHAWWLPAKPGVPSRARCCTCMATAATWPGTWAAVGGCRSRAIRC